LALHPSRYQSVVKDAWRDAESPGSLLATATLMVSSSQLWWDFLRSEQSGDRTELLLTASKTGKILMTELAWFTFLRNVDGLRAHLVENLLASQAHPGLKEFRK